MKQHRFSRTEMLIGTENLNKLKESKILVFGVGGVGSYAVEALARAGVGKLRLVDFDDVCLTNCNRQIHALKNTIGKVKAEVMGERVKLINPECEVEVVKEFYTPENGDELLEGDFHYVIDAIDTVSAKLHLIETCVKNNIPIISAMGAGNKLFPEMLEIADISQTTICPLARVVRRELKKRGISKGVEVVYSKEVPRKPIAYADCKNNCICPGGDGHCTKKRQIPGSISYVPSVAGLLMAGRVINRIIGVI
ncbi:tRNA threonylcarbamoyladenosine dehydratase [Anaerobranca gottschalkii]|uniref:tRNA A37 threonylcarbamoyladenosine dehydratase n=1 Tax=Anaerobranca gottschalkii DSM 13577 TaxID=1120990 RepID=A0A1I0ASJ3_9FIRM|nr:tRNA threonylcarbamoyladenosine dehydratase [Anaerobranca gottschalkii]SES97325.1 tRNA A37 threonylcarbamoyladenosine dehydratase [Anaerobranca gottschalkii DSM 13577]